MTRDERETAPEDDRTENDEVLRLDRELAVANDLAPDDTRRARPGITPREPS